jgi:hypothetical protein
MTVPERVHTVVDDYLSIVDKLAPGLVQGLYLVGSVALDDFRPRASDVDFVAVTEKPLDAAAIEAVRRTHAELTKRHPRPHFNGPYVTWADLASDPREAAPGAHLHDAGVLDTTNRDERHPVAWHTLAQCGIALRGPDPHTLDLWTDATSLANSIRENLDAYWRPWHSNGSRPLSKPGLATLTNWGSVWIVLGVSRLHYTLTTGKITSKTGAGTYARQEFPANWHKIIDECLRIRRSQSNRSLYRSRWTRRQDTLAYLDHVITDAHAIA